MNNIFIAILSFFLLGVASPKPEIKLPPQKKDPIWERGLPDIKVEIVSPEEMEIIWTNRLEGKKKTNAPGKKDSTLKGSTRSSLLKGQKEAKIYLADCGGTDGGDIPQSLSQKGIPVAVANFDYRFYDSTNEKNFLLEDNASIYNMEEIFQTYEDSEVLISEGISASIMINAPQNPCSSLLFGMYFIHRHELETAVDVRASYYNQRAQEVLRNLAYSNGETELYDYLLSYWVKATQNKDGLTSYASYMAEKYSKKPLPLRVDIQMTSIKFRSGLLSDEDYKSNIKSFLGKDGSSGVASHSYWVDRIGKYVMTTNEDEKKKAALSIEKEIPELVAVSKNRFLLYALAHLTSEREDKTEFFAALKGFPGHENDERSLLWRVRFLRQTEKKYQEVIEVSKHLISLYGKRMEILPRLEAEFVGLSASILAGSIKDTEFFLSRLVKSFTDEPRTLGLIFWYLENYSVHAEIAKEKETSAASCKLLAVEISVFSDLMYGERFYPEIGSALIKSALDITERCPTSEISIRDYSSAEAIERGKHEQFLPRAYLERIFKESILFDKEIIESSVAGKFREVIVALASASEYEKVETFIKNASKKDLLVRPDYLKVIEAVLLVKQKKLKEASIVVSDFADKPYGIEAINDFKNLLSASEFSEFVNSIPDQPNEVENNE